MITIELIVNPEDLQVAFKIRKEVFVNEQNVPESEEYDEYEKEARHFLAFFNSIACGTARWRFTKNGIKLERFAVKKEYRGMGVGLALVKAVLKDVQSHPLYTSQNIYLHAQLTAMSLYQKVGFEKIGEMFLECDIQHYKMIL